MTENYKNTDLTVQVFICNILLLASWPACIALGFYWYGGGESTFEHVLWGLAYSIWPGIIGIVVTAGALQHLESIERETELRKRKHEKRQAEQENLARQEEAERRKQIEREELELAELLERKVRAVRQAELATVFDDHTAKKMLEHVEDDKHLNKIVSFGKSLGTDLAVAYTEGRVAAKALEKVIAGSLTKAELWGYIRRWPSGLITHYVEGRMNERECDAATDGVLEQGIGFLAVEFMFGRPDDEKENVLKTKTNTTWTYYEKRRDARKVVHRKVKFSNGRVIGWEQ